MSQTSTRPTDTRMARRSSCAATHRREACRITVPSVRRASAAAASAAACLGAAAAATSSSRRRRAPAVRGDRPWPRMYRWAWRIVMPNRSASQRVAPRPWSARSAASAESRSVGTAELAELAEACAAAIRSAAASAAWSPRSALIAAIASLTVLGRPREAIACWNLTRGPSR